MGDGRAGTLQDALDRVVSDYSTVGITGTETAIPRTTVFMTSMKISAALVDHLANTSDVNVELVVELKPAEPSHVGASSREERIARLREAFEREAAPVEAAIRSAGGKVLERAWLNQTVRARVPRTAVEVLAALDEVFLLDLPRALQPADA